MANSESADVYFGAVYFRKTNPPKNDWERDFKKAAEDGHNLFRHWVPWGAVEVAPGRYDWDDYDVILDLSAKYNIKAVLAEMIVNAPEWFVHEYPHTVRENSQGVKKSSEMHVSCVTGGSHVTCLDHDEVRQASARFLTAMAERYKDHPGFFGYDIWNECSFYSPANLCYCPATEEEFRTWLRNRYQSPEELAVAWKRYSYTEWDQVRMPRSTGPYPDVMDRIAFHTDNAFSQMKWRYDLLKSVDKKNPVTTHGNGKTFSDAAPAAGDDFRAAEHCDIFGYTYWWSNRCHVLMCGDTIRGAAKGKAFWRAEALGDSEWAGRDVGPHIPEKDAMHEPANIRLDCLLSYVSGATAYQNPRWRGLLDGPLFGAYGWYGMGGEATERSEEAARLAKWVTSRPMQDVFRAKPVKGEVAILFVDEAQAFDYAYYKHTGFYSWCVQGAWEAFHAANIQCDFIKTDQLDEYKLVFVPFPVALSDHTLARVRDWVDAGGTLISEACYGYLDHHAHAYPNQPSRGSAELFGCRELSVSFAPDRWAGLNVRTYDGAVQGHIYRQSYEATTGKATGWFDDGTVAVVENSFGNGRTRLVGTMVGYGYKSSPTESSRDWFASILSFAGIKPNCRCNHRLVVARLWRDESERRTYLWLVNEQDLPLNVEVEVNPEIAAFGRIEVLRGDDAQISKPNTVTTCIAAKDGLVLELI